MTKRHEELLKEYWSRPAYHKHAMGSNWSLFFNKIAKIIIPFIAFLLLICLMFFTTQTHFISKSFTLRFYQKAQNTPHYYPRMQCFSWYNTKTCPKLNATKVVSSKPTKTCPEYFRWIHEDLKPWKKTGITKQSVEAAEKTANFRLIILDGKVYMEHFRPAYETRSSFTLWGFIQLARRYPGKLPDLELMFDTADRPVVEAEKYRGNDSDPPPPLFRYCSDSDHLDLVLPDWSYWGWVETNIRPWKGMMEDIRRESEKTKWEDREPYAYWKGNPHIYAWRNDLMTCNVSDEYDWNARLYIQDWRKEIRTGFKHSNLEDQCTHRYKVYIDGWAWSISEKYILACNSPTLLVTLRWYDFFIRGMIPQHHYWPIRDDDKCKSLKFAVEWGNNHTKKAKAIGEAGSRFIYENVKMEFVYDYMFHMLNEYAKLMNYKPTITPHAEELCAEQLGCAIRPTTRRKFTDESLERYPSDSSPCAMVPPYEPHELRDFKYQQMKATKQVEAWEDEYWATRNTDQ